MFQVEINQPDEAPAPSKASWLPSVSIFGAVLILGFLLLLVAAAIVLSLIPVYLLQRNASVVPVCSSCKIDVYNQYTNSTTGTIMTDNVGYYTCAQFCSGSLTGGASGATYPSNNYAGNAATSLGGKSYTCNIGSVNRANCINSYGSSSTQAGLFYLSGTGTCSSPYTSYRCCCKSSSG